ncbi:MAG: hypothetical protein HC927_02050 [Deltaproteobacteria bacterium]|nr:hypothetical protein [Deltaproteobacteria bacterium]
MKHWGNLEFLPEFLDDRLDLLRSQLRRGERIQRLVGAVPIHLQTGPHLRGSEEIDGRSELVGVECQTDDLDLRVEDRANIVVLDEVIGRSLASDDASTEEDECRGEDAVRTR